MGRERNEMKGDKILAKGKRSLKTAPRTETVEKCSTKTNEFLAFLYLCLPVSVPETVGRG